MKQIYPVRRRALQILAAVGLIPFGATAFADTNAVQRYPEKPIRLIVSYPAGGTADLLSRAIGEGLNEIFKQPVIVENRPGANGNIAAGFVATQPKDGYTLLMTAPGPVAVNANLYSSLPFNPEKDFSPVARVAIAPLLLVVPSALPVKTLDELLAYLKTNPDKATFASQGNASSGHLAMELLKSKAAFDAVHAPYKGSAPALVDLIAGHVTMMFDNTTSSMPHVRSGTLRAIAVAENRRISAAPDVPTVEEAGVKGFAATPWFGLVTTAGTPPGIIEKLNGAIQQVLKKPAVRTRFEGMGVELINESPEAFARYIQSEREKWKEVIRVSGTKVE